MSDIIKARQLLAAALRMQEQTRKMIEQALDEMHRVEPVRHASPKRKRIDAKMRAAVFALSADPNLSQHDIANLVGLNNAGRVSEVLHGKR